MITATPLTEDAFRPFGDVLDATGDPDKIINAGLCGRFHDRAQLDFGTGGRAGISLFRAELRTLPLELDLMERHPEGSQAFLPLDAVPFLVIVAPDSGGQPGQPIAFLSRPGQGVNYHRGTWHGVLTPVTGNGIFAVIDRIGTTPNLEEYHFPAPFLVTAKV